MKTKEHRPRGGRGIHALRPGLTLLWISALSGIATPLGAQTGDALEGAWTAERYHLADGPIHPVRGQIFFVEGSWQVLFFVMDGDGVPRRGSGEGGTYERTADGVVFRHLFHLSAGNALPGLEAAPLRMTVRDPDEAALEPTRIDVEGAVLTLHFPSGNRMTFRRPSG